MLINSTNSTERHRGGAAPTNTKTKLRWPDTSEQHARRIKNDRRNKPAKRKRHVKSKRDDAKNNEELPLGDETPGTKGRASAAGERGVIDAAPASLGGRNPE